MTLKLKKVGFVVFDAVYSYAVWLSSLALLSSIARPPICM